MIIIKRKPIIENGRVMIVKTQFNEFKQKRIWNTNKKITKIIESKNILRFKGTFKFNNEPMNWEYWNWSVMISN